jgi:Rieske Fe-S protein
MATKSKTSAADSKANVTPATTKATAVNATTETKATANSTVEAKAVEAPAKKATAKKPATKKPATKKATTAKKTTAKKEAAVINTTYVLQFSGKEVVASDILETVKKVWVDKFQGKLEEIKTIEIYIKPEEHRAYFVVNGLSNGDYFVEL